MIIRCTIVSTTMIANKMNAIAAPWPHAPRAWRDRTGRSWFPRQRPEFLVL
jgi:hypothetical protein